MRICMYYMLQKRTAFQEYHGNGWRGFYVGSSVGTAENENQDGRTKTTTEEKIREDDKVAEEEEPNELEQEKQVFVLTAYCPCEKCCGKDLDDPAYGITSTGTVATQGRTIAVYPSQIPYGSTVLVDGVEYIAEDCGGAIKENRLDIYYDSHQDALEWGVRYCEVSVIYQTHR